jgi:cytochrome c biogenesis protein CcmG/thiol:disulfide interchange protein DsbE
MTVLDTSPDSPPTPPGGTARRRLWRVLALLMVVSVLFLVLVTRLEGQPPARSVLLDGPAPDLQGKTLDGATFDLADWRGEVVLVNVWASWCVPCQQEQPLLVSSYRELAPRGLQIVGINVRDKPEEARAFMQEFGQAPWPSVQDPDGRRAVDWGTFALPETYLVDADGTVVAKAVGELDAAWIQQNVTPLLPPAAS